MPENRAVLSGILKYAFSALLTLATLLTTGNVRYLVVGLLELLVILAVTERLLEKNQTAGTLCNCVFLLLYNIQMTVLFFGSSYVMLVMVTNLDSLEALSGKALQYGLGTALVFVFSLLPVRKVLTRPRSWTYGLLSVCLALELCVTLLWGNAYSPMFAVYTLTAEAVEQDRLRRSIVSDENVTSAFYSSGIDDYIKKDAALPENPNIILIFAEGLSRHIMLDERNIMPNAARFERETLHFTGYYNHAFATYRGLIGQLYSGYQLDHLDKNTLVSMQSILKDRQYWTAFINTQPNNSDFTQYLQNFEFDAAPSDTSGRFDGLAQTTSDKRAYELLFDTACQQARESDKPFFVSIYTLGTHVSFDSPDAVFGSGSDPLLNRFHNSDAWFGDFLEKFRQSELHENTVLIFTTDHGTYIDSDYRNAFPDSTRLHNLLDEVPLCIYYKGVTPRAVPVGGRNTLDMAPTVFDLLDISAPNYFLGCSLFAPKASAHPFETVFWIGGGSASTGAERTEMLFSAAHEEIEERIKLYCIAKTQEPTFTAGPRSLVDASDLDNTLLDAVLSPDYATLQLTLTTNNHYERVWFPVWSEEDNQDDLQWYEAQKQGEGVWTYTVDMHKHRSVGQYTVEGYGDTMKSEGKIVSIRMQIDHTPHELAQKAQEPAEKAAA